MQFIHRANSHQALYSLIATVSYSYLEEHTLNNTYSRENFQLMSEK